MANILPEKGDAPVLAPLCQVCQIVPSKYCCPNESCAKLTCSLVCCKQHKLDSGCNGKRDRTAFKPMSSYQAKDLQSDYHLLENISLGVDRAKRSRSRDAANGNKWNLPDEKNAKRRMAADEKDDSIFPSANLDIAPLPKNHMSGSSKKLLNVAHRFNIGLQLMPVGMSRHQRNTTKCDGVSIQWLVQFEFDIPNQACHVMYCESVDQNESWISVLNSMLLENQGGSAETRHILRQYCELLHTNNHQQICLLLKKEPSPANNISYFHIEQESTISASLANKTIIEFPVVKVVLMGSLHLFKLEPKLIQAVP
jgi:hypothetical protein